MIVLGHRGSALHRESENTLEAFDAAMRAGAAGVETDVRMTGDGALVLLHDAWLDDFRRINRLTAEEVDRCRAGQGRPPAVRVDEALAAFPGAVWNLEIKDPAAAGPLDELLRRHDGISVLLTSFHHAAVGGRRGARGDRRAGWLHAHRPASVVQFVAALNAASGIDTVVFDAQFCDEPLLAACREAGYATGVYNAVPGDEGWLLARETVDYLITDHVEHFLGCRRERESP
ncbi:glycerophosphodiester phosphodiesterase family protein [Aquisalimonas lutea]|uniref:glycerophosphodiester phosphodiesterase n=1 Tax=Aquisalimonas lutea TaxID=1327750 RepID=UPI0025B34CFE|nr:glycerophosphodiester phosphodiesterase family protein [Aquisalimonas lutea]MDN3518534.1 glycerophosphodiester phosphodiesterase family protein [Aquisalimonas lutea]